jgi:hypothetical protein
MIVRALDSNRDWTFGKGKNNYVKDNSAVALLIDMNLNSYYGDCFFDSEFGIDWFNLIGSKNVPQAQIAINAAILNTPYVQSTVQLNVSLNQNRTMTATYQVVTLYSTNKSTGGAITIGGQINA